MNGPIFLNRIAQVHRDLGEVAGSLKTLVMLGAVEPDEAERIVRAWALRMEGPIKVSDAMVNRAIKAATEITL